MPTKHIAPMFNRGLVAEKSSRIISMRDKYIQRSNTEIERLKTLGVNDENTTMIKTEQNKKQLTEVIAELITLTEISFIPKMNFLYEVLNSLESVSWLDAAEKATIREFNLLTKDLITTAGEVDLTNIINNDNDSSIYRQAESLSNKMNSGEFRRYFQSMTMLSSILSNMTTIENNHKKKLGVFLMKKETQLTKSPYNYTTLKYGTLNLYTTQPMQMSMRYALLYAEILKYTERAVTPNPQTEEEIDALTSVKKAHKFCTDKAELTNEIEREYKKHNATPTISPAKGTNYAPIIATVALGVALGVGLAFGLLALGVFPPLGLGILALTVITASYYGVIGGVIGAIFPKILKKEAPTAVEQNTQPVEAAAPQRKRINVGSINIVRAPSEQEPVELRIKPLKNEEAFFEVISPTDNGDKKRFSSGMEPSPKTTTSFDDPASNDSAPDDIESVQVASN